MAVNIVFGYICLGAGIILYGAAAYLTIWGKEKEPSGAGADAITSEELKAIFEAVKDIFKELNKMSKSLQVFVFGTVLAGIGIFLLTM